MKNTRRAFLIAAWLACALAAAACAATPSPADAPRPRNLVFMIPDGCGPASIVLGRMCAGRPLALDSILVGASETSSTSSRVTDSAAGVTAYASGIKTGNAMLGLDPEERPVGTLLEAAQARGMRTGMVVTCRLTHATPAAFASHVPDRGAEDSIAVQELEHGVDLLLGGGRANFLPAGAGGGRRDGRDLLGEARRRGCQVVATRAEILKPLRLPVLGIFTADHMSYDIERDPAAEPSLEEMTRRALELLGGSPRGFFLMIEGSRIDHAGHENDPATQAREVLAYDAAVRAALQFARREAHTLVVSVSDHETGGMTLCRQPGSGDTPIYEFHPEPLLEVHASAQAMARKIHAGADPRAVLAADAGVDSLSDGEVAGLRDTAISEKRRIARVGDVESRRALVGWTTLGHTAVDVGLYAFGPGASRLRGFHPNDEVGRIVAAVMGLDLAAETRRLRGKAMTRAAPAR